MNAHSKSALRDTTPASPAPGDRRGSAGRGPTRDGSCASGHTIAARGGVDGTPAVPRRDRRSLAFAWLATLTLSSLPTIVLVEATGMSRAAPTAWVLAAAAPLLALTWTWRPARPLRPYLVVMLPVFCVAYVLPPVLSGWLDSDGSGLGGVLLNKTVFLLLAAAMAALVVTGLGRAPREAFLTSGNMSAPSTLRLPGTGRNVSWAVLGTIAAVALFSLMATVTWLDLGLHPAAAWERLEPMLPLVVGCAAFNALGEEVVYRSGPLATLFDVVGPRQAVLLTSVWFGLAHYFGSVPEGPAGVLQSGVLALLLGGAMVATRGLGWPWLIHVAVDLVVFASIAVTIT